MNQKERTYLRRLRRQLSRRINDEVRCALLRREDNVLDAVSKIVEQDCAWLLARLTAILRMLQIRTLVQHALRRITIKKEDEEESESEPRVAGPEEGKEAADNGAAHATGRQMWFAGMEVFRGVTDSITYLKPDGSVDYMLYRFTRTDQRNGMNALDHKQEVQDAARRNRRLRANQAAEPMVAEFGDLPLEELVRLWVAKYGEDAGTTAASQG
jgi:hypothetical protein